MMRSSAPPRNRGAAGEEGARLRERHDMVQRGELQQVKELLEKTRQQQQVGGGRSFVLAALRSAPLSSAVGRRTRTTSLSAPPTALPYSTPHCSARVLLSAERTLTPALACARSRCWRRTRR